MLGDQYHRSIGDFSLPDDLSTIFSHGSSGHSDIDDFHCIDVEDPLSPPFVSFSDYFHGSVVDGGQLVDTPSTHTALLGASGGGGKLWGSGRTSTPVTPKSSVSWSSTEAAAGEEDSVRCKKEVGAEEKQLAKDEEQGGADKSKKANNKPRKKGEKRQREPRFAFVTKSEVDHLEDGYRWRKYGQKAVKNSPYPRSYYRCTTQECLVKKRVERSFKEPSIVITTYEGQHTHQSPAAVRAGSSHVLPPPPQAAMPPSSLGFHQDLLMHQYVLDNNNSQLMMMMQAREIMNPNMYMPSPLQQQQQLKFPDHGLLQDIVLSSNPNQP